MASLKKKSLILILIALFSCLMIAFTTTLLTTHASGSTVFSSNGASVRIGTGEDETVDDNGIRFEVVMDTATYETVSANAYETGVLFMPSDLLTGDLSLETDKVGKAITTGKWVKKTYAEPDANGIYKIAESGTELMTSAAYLYDIPKGSYNRPYSFRGYYMNGATPVYTDVMERSMAEVSLASQLQELDKYLLNYGVSFVDNEDKDVSAELTPVSVKYGSAVGELPTYAKDGYTFNGWRPVDEYTHYYVASTTKILGATTYKASLTPNTFSNIGKYKDVDYHVAPTLKVSTTGTVDITNQSTTTHKLDTAGIELKTDTTQGQALIGVLDYGTADDRNAIQLTIDGGYDLTHVKNIKIGYRLASTATAGGFNFALDGKYVAWHGADSINGPSEWLEKSISADKVADGVLNSIEIYNTGSSTNFYVEIGYVVFEFNAYYDSAIASGFESYYSAPRAYLADAGTSLTVAGASVTALGSGERVSDTDTITSKVFKATDATSAKIPYFIYDNVDLSGVSNITIKYKCTSDGTRGMNIDVNNTYTKWLDAAVLDGTWRIVEIPYATFSSKLTDGKLTSIDFRLGSGIMTDIYIDYILFQSNTTTDIIPCKTTSIDFTSNNQLLAKHFSLSGTVGTKSVGNGLLTMQLTDNAKMIEINFDSIQLTTGSTITIVATFETTGGGAGIYVNTTTGNFNSTTSGGVDEGYAVGLSDDTSEQSKTFTYTGESTMTLNKLLIKQYYNGVRNIQIKSITITQA